MIMMRWNEDINDGAVDAKGPPEGRALTLTFLDGALFLCSITSTVPLYLS